jgi:O-acetyl-ADP-ribose deacetylase
VTGYGEAMKVTVGTTAIELLKGDITEQQVDAIVNAANSSLQGGGGVDGAIHRAAGPRLAAAGKALGGCPPGEARITPGFDLPARWVVHTVGPVYRGGDEGEPEILAAAHRSSLLLAIDHDVETIAFPAISTGVYGYPPQLAAPIALSEVIAAVQGPSPLTLVRFVLFSDELLATFWTALERLAPATG